MYMTVDTAMWDYQADLDKPRKILHFSLLMVNLNANAAWWLSKTALQENYLKHF